MMSVVQHSMMRCLNFLAGPSLQRAVNPVTEETIAAVLDTDLSVGATTVVVHQSQAADSE